MYRKKVAGRQAAFLDTRNVVCADNLPRAAPRHLNNLETCKTVACRVSIVEGVGSFEAAMQNDRALGRKCRWIDYAPPQIDIGDITAANGAAVTGYVSWH